MLAAGCEQVCFLLGSLFQTEQRWSLQDVAEGKPGILGAFDSFCVNHYTLTKEKGSVSGFMGCDAERCPAVHHLQSVSLGCSPSSAVTSFCTVPAGAQIQSGRFSAVRSTSPSLFFF